MQVKPGKRSCWRKDEALQTSKAADPIGWKYSAERGPLYPTPSINKIVPVPNTLLRASL